MSLRKVHEGSLWLFWKNPAFFPALWYLGTPANSGKDFPTPNLLFKQGGWKVCFFSTKKALHDFNRKLSPQTKASPPALVGPSVEDSGAVCILKSWSLLGDWGQNTGGGCAFFGGEQLKPLFWKAWIVDVCRWLCFSKGDFQVSRWFLGVYASTTCRDQRILWLPHHPDKYCSSLQLTSHSHKRSDDWTAGHFQHQPLYSFSRSHNLSEGSASQPATVQQKDTPKLRPQLNGALLKASDGSANPQRFIKE